MKVSFLALAALFLCPSVQAATAFETAQALHGITFKVTSPNAPTANSVTVTPTGLEIDNSPITVKTSGVVTGAEVGDINADGSPSRFTFTSSNRPAINAPTSSPSAPTERNHSALYTSPRSKTTLATPRGIAAGMNSRSSKASSPAASPSSPKTDPKRNPPARCARSNTSWSPEKPAGS